MYKRQEIDSPYNTYINPGLTPGPICNPGLSAIQAAIYPADTDYYFFALGTDGKSPVSYTHLSCRYPMRGGACPILAKTRAFRRRE